jgi:hypothetical protein
MSRKIYRYDRGAGTLRLVSETNTGPATSAGPFILRDPEAYQSPTTGRWIETRKERREDLARSGCIPTRELKGERLANGNIHKG